MYLLRIQFSITDLIVLQLLAIVLGFVVHFVLVNRRKLQHMVEESKRRTSLTGSGGRYPDEPLKPKWEEKKKLFAADRPMPFAAVKIPKAAAQPADVAVMPDVLQDLKQSIRQQQKTLDQLLTRVDKLDAPEDEVLAQTTVSARALEEKESELQKTKQQLSAAQKVAGRVTEVYQEFDLLQQKMAELEESAGKAAELAMELDDVQQAYLQLKKESARKQE